MTATPLLDDARSFRGRVWHLVADGRNTLCGIYIANWMHSDRRVADPDEVDRCKACRRQAYRRGYGAYEP